MLAVLKTRPSALCSGGKRPRSPNGGLVVRISSIAGAENSAWNPYSHGSRTPTATRTGGTELIDRCAAERPMRIRARECIEDD
jgi:hypothetical protein